MSGANYGGKQPTNTTYVKQFVSAVAGYANWVYKNKSNPNTRYITPVTPDNVLLEKNKIASHSKEAFEKRIKTMKEKNHDFQSSKVEDKLYEIFKINFLSLRRFYRKRCIAN